MKSGLVSLLTVGGDQASCNRLFHSLHSSGYRFAAAADCNQALAMLEERLYDLMLLDLPVFKTTGKNIIQTVRKRYSPRQLPIIVIAPEKDGIDVDEILKAGANDVIFQPLECGMLEGKIKQQLINIKSNHERGSDSSGQGMPENPEIYTGPLDQHFVDLPARDRIFNELLLRTVPIIAYATRIGASNDCYFVSANAYAVLGYKPEEMYGGDFWYAHVHPGDRATATDQIRHNLVNGHGSAEYRFLHGDNKYLWIQDTHQVIRENNEPVEVIGTWMDITDRKALKERLDYESSRDALTGLINNAAFEQHLLRILDDKGNSTMHYVLCFIDLDLFKIITNTYGTVAGDELLRQISKILRKTFNQNDILARMCGDKFAVLLKHYTLNQADKVLETVQEAIHEFRFSWKGMKHAITASIGVVPVNRHSLSLSNMLGMADTACNIAKEAGRDRIHVFTDGEFLQRQDQMLWVERINRALEEDRFYLYYQPIISLHEDIKERHFELLVRMKDKNEKLVPPDQFLRAAERFNLASKIDRWVIQTTFSWLEAYSELLDEDYCWGINLSGQSMADQALIQFVFEDMKRKQIPPHKIYFEITETTAITHIENAIRFINTLKKYKCKFALDDFGSGLSSFAYLKDLNVDYLKIDGSFVKNMLEDEVNLVITTAMNNVAHALGKKTIAEFVESDAIKAKLKEIGVDFAQGYGICKPRPLSEFTT